MRITPTAIADVRLIEPQVFEDERGFFYESFNSKEFSKAIGHDVNFVQDNHSRSGQNVLRGLHYQVEYVQAKLVRAVVGEILDVALDIRKGSSTFGQHVAVRLSASNRRMLWIPEGFAHGFAVLTEVAECLYKATDYYAPEHERVLAWNDPALGIDWCLTGAPILSARDQKGVNLDKLELINTLGRH